jgi:uncharacterized coiled-coil protein SlyX
MVLVKQTEELADAIIAAQSILDESQQTLDKMLEEMRAVDIKGSFEADDEVGAVFTELKDIIEKYKN